MQHYLIDSRADLERLMQAPRPQSDTRIGDMLVADGVISASQLDRVLAEQRLHPGKHVGELLIEANLCSREQIREALANKLGFPVVSLGQYEVPPTVLSLVPTDIARQYKVLPLAEISNHLFVAMESPLDQEAINALRINTNRPIEPLMVPADQIQQALDRYYRQMMDGEIEGMVEALEFTEGQDEGDVDDLNALAAEAQKKPVVRLVDAIILNGILEGASDINIRPEKDSVAIYYRIDGKLHLSRTLKRSLLPPLVSRIKISGRMDIAERRLPQDGHARVTHEGRSIDLRISSVPTVAGESVVIRILDKEAGVKPLADVGFSDRDLAIMRMMLRRSHGLILVTGPTGSGKSTTLYALLSELRDRQPHIITIEDPVEYDMSGVEQIQILPAIGYTFGRALRNILRHDPDVIMVGEIRDEETAQIANKAALTGHLVLSTLHTNDAASTVTRLFDMGIEPYLLGSTLLGVMAQRLVRLNCPHCLTEDRIEPQARAILGLGIDEIFYHGAGCEHCHDTGYHGRTVVYELMGINPELAALISKGADALALKKRAEELGMLSLTAHAIELARKKITSIEEVLSIRLD